VAALLKRAVHFGLPLPLHTRTILTKHSFEEAV
jgi:hypothetical protein